MEEAAQQEPMKFCKTCNPPRFKPISEFHKANKGSFGRQAKCKDCQQAWHSQPSRAEKRRKTVKDSKAKNPERVKSGNREYMLQKKFGIGTAQYDLLLKKQKGVCAICKKPPSKRRLAVDHDHNTGQIRGLLCTYCNVLIGVMESNFERFRNAALYLDKAGLFGRLSND